MALRGVIPKKTEKRLKALFYGIGGAGKTTAAISFPLPYLIDTEDGSGNDKYIDIIIKNGGSVFKTTDFDELMVEIKELLVVDHPYKTLIIDPLTIVYDQLLDQCALKVGTDFGRHYSEANKKMKRLMNMLIRLDMNVIITSHAKNEYGPNMAVLGQTFDCYKKLEYLFDLIFEVQKKGGKHIGVTKKSRIESFPIGEAFEFSYDQIANRYGRDILEKSAIPQPLASKEQIQELLMLFNVLNTPAEWQQKWLTKSNCDDFCDMIEPVIQKGIDHLKSKITLTKNGA